MPSSLSPILDFPLGGPPPDPLPSDPVAEDLFGTDLYFDGNLRVDATGDYTEIAGITNLRRAVTRRLTTRPGEYRVNPQYGAGLQDFVKKPRTKATLDDIKQRVIEQLSRERRIDKVIEVTPTYMQYGSDLSNTGLKLLIRVQALGRDIRFQPFNFAQEPSI